MSLSLLNNQVKSSATRAVCGLSGFSTQALFAGTLLLVLSGPVVATEVYIQDLKRDGGNTYVDDDITVRGRWMDCVTSGDEARITLFKGKNMGQRNAKLRNAAITDLKGWYFGTYSDGHEANDLFQSVTVENGSWEICEDSHFEGPCKVLHFPGDFSASLLGSLAGEISSVRPVGCHDNNSANIRMNPSELRRPTNSHTQHAECLLMSDMGIIANNGKVMLTWMFGMLNVVEMPGGNVLWKTEETWGKGLRVCFDSYANLAIYSTSPTEPIWQTGGIEANSEAELILRDNCELTITVGLEDVWSNSSSCD